MTFTGLGIVALVYLVSLKHSTPSSLFVVFDTYTEKPSRNCVLNSFLSKKKNRYKSLKLKTIKYLGILIIRWTSYRVKSLWTSVQNIYSIKSLRIVFSEYVIKSNMRTIGINETISILYIKSFTDVKHTLKLYKLRYKLYRFKSTWLWCFGNIKMACCNLKTKFHFNPWNKKKYLTYKVQIQNTQSCFIGTLNWSVLRTL